MKLKRMLWMIGFFLIVVLFLLPIPHIYEDEGAWSLRPILPLYEICFFDRPFDQTAYPHMSIYPTRERGVEIRIVGTPVHMRTSYSYETDAAR